jgi:hypothetical protein
MLNSLAGICIALVDSLYPVDHNQLISWKFGGCLMIRDVLSVLLLLLSTTTLYVMCYVAVK